MRPSRSRGARLGAAAVPSAAALAVGMTALGALPASAPAAPATAIRVGGPSAPGDAKVALVGTGARLAGRRFTVVDRRGRTVLRGRLTAASGSPSPWRRVWRADLSRITRPGAYRVRAAGRTSRAWTVRSGASSAPVRTILRFFAANADGREPSPVHGPSHLQDAIVADGPLAGQRVDLTGGWMDAGDTLKVTHTTAYATAALLAAARLDPADAPALRAAAEVGVRWLVKAHPAPGVFIAQVGDARDHEVGFRDPAADDASSAPGIGVRVAYPGIGGDLGGKVALALALAAETRPAGGERDALVTAAREWYDAGRATGRTMPQLPDPAGDFYVGDTQDDALAAGAAALHRVTGDPALLQDAVTHLAAFEPDGRLSWNALAGLAAADLCGRLGAPAAGDAAARDAGCGALVAQGRAAIARAGRSAFATPGAIGWGQTGENGGAGTLATLAGRAGLARGLAVGAAARDWLLGRNPWGASFVAGLGPSAPRALHHWASLRGPGLPVGAVVGGPAPRDEILRQGFGAPRASPFSTTAATYEDRVEDYVTSEPALDYAASSVLLLAALQAR